MRPTSVGRPSLSATRSSTRAAEIAGRREVLVPHPDHETVLSAALDAAAALPHLDLLLYEELPYAFGGGGDDQARTSARRLRRRSTPLSVTVTREAKAERIAAYGSQIPALVTDAGRLDDPESLPEEERYWLIPAAAGAGR